MVKKNKGKMKAKPKDRKRIGKYGLTTNWELMQIAGELGFSVEVLSKNHLMDKVITETGNYIINLQNSNEGGGTHWVGLIVYPKKAFYYDSFGFLPPLEVIHYVNPIKKNCLQPLRELYVANKQIQNQYGAYCGQYVSDFLRYMNQEKQDISPLERFNTYLNMWKAR